MVGSGSELRDLDARPEDTNKASYRSLGHLTAHQWESRAVAPSCAAGPIDGTCSSGRQRGPV